MANILVVDDEPILAKNIAEAMRLGGHDAVVVGTGEDCLAAAQANPPDVVLLDLRLPGIDGIDVLRELQRRETSASVIMMTAHGNVDSAVEAMKLGAGDFLTKPLDLKELQLVVERVLKHRMVTANLNYFRNRERAEGAFADIIGESPAMATVKRFVERLIATPALASDQPPSVLITGETGTGKDLIARALHYSGARSAGPFVHVNCTALPEHLVEAELFGHVKGAFTDARGDKRGLFETANGGTIFLDEIGHMKLSLQAKLLNAIESRTIRPVGGTSDRKINLHVIAATNRDLEEAIEAREFREDLYHRLRVLTIQLPALRERGDDLFALAGHFLKIHSARFAIPMDGFADDALEAMRAYDWPGNVRELLHSIESAVLMADSPLIRRENLNIIPSNKQGGMAIDMPRANESIVVDFDGEGPKLDDIEYRIISAALEHSGHNLSRAARILGISRDAVRYRLAKYREAKGLEGA